MPRKKKNKSRIKYYSRIKTKPVIKFINIHEDKKDDISPGRLVCAAEYIEDVIGR